MTAEPPAIKSESEPTSRKPPFIGRDVSVGLGVWLITGVIILGSGWFGWKFVMPRAEPGAPTVLAALAHWDGGWYTSIVNCGYRFDPEDHSNVAFFPAYPSLAGALTLLMDFDSRISLLLISHLFMALSLIVLHSYLRHRFPEAGNEFWRSGCSALPYFRRLFSFGWPIRNLFFFSWSR